MTRSPIYSVVVAVALVIAAACRVAAPARSQEEPPPTKSRTVVQDLESLQGRWERKLPGGDDSARKGEARAVKEIKGNKETVTYYDDAGKAVRATTADFELEQSGRVRLYTFSNLKVTLGDDKGDTGLNKPLSYIYRVEGDTYHEGHGLLTDSPAGSKPSVARWDRAK
jgi:hypothetical protein